MKIKGLIEEDFLQYKKPSMFIITSFCSFKCEKEYNCPGMCQNSSLATSMMIDVDNQTLVNRFMNNKITTAIVFGGLEPFDQKDELLKLIADFRKVTDADIVIYTGYTEEEIKEEINSLKIYKNIIIKFGRYIPNELPHLDPVLKVKLASQNQYAKKIT